MENTENTENREDEEHAWCSEKGQQNRALLLRLRAQKRVVNYG